MMVSVFYHKGLRKGRHRHLKTVFGYPKTILSKVILRSNIINICSPERTRLEREKLPVKRFEKELHAIIFVAFVR